MYVTIIKKVEFKVMNQIVEYIKNAIIVIKEYIL